MIVLQESRCAYVLILMAVYWCFEVLPIPITALVPVLLFPLLKVLPTNVVAANYFKVSDHYTEYSGIPQEINFLLFGGLICLLQAENICAERRQSQEAQPVEGRKIRLIAIPHILIFRQIVSNIQQAERCEQKAHCF